MSTQDTHAEAQARRLPNGKYFVPGHPRHVGPGPGHLSECLLVAYSDHPYGCTCDDDSPEWTTS